MALDFPASPSNGQQFTGPGGVIWVYDSTKTAWVSGTLTTGVYAPITNDNGRNLIHNSAFTIAQRLAGPFTTLGAYTLDRWFLGGLTDAASIQQSALGDAGRGEIGDEEAGLFFLNTFTGNAAAGANNTIIQRIENVRRLAGKTVTISFWAKATSGTPKLGINLLQNFGTGGSPSLAAQVLTTGIAVTPSTTAWTRYNTTIAVPVISGVKTVGTTAPPDHYTALQFWFSSGATNNATAGNIGVQSGAIALWGVQLEIGSVATPLEKRDPALELQQCQRMYCTFAVNVPAAAAPDNLVFPTTMRAAPSTIAGGGTGFAATNTSAAAVTISQTTAAAQTLTFSAEL